jgi:hypothetical protein
MIAVFPIVYIHVFCMIPTLSNNYLPNSINQLVFAIKMQCDFCDLRITPPLPHHLQGLSMLDPSGSKYETSAFINII